MNRRNFFKAAGAVMVGGVVGAQVQPSAPTYEWDLGELIEMPLLPYSHHWHNSSEDRSLRMAREEEDRALRLERLRQDHEEQIKQIVAQSLTDILASYD